MAEKNRVYYTPLELAEMFGVSRRTIYAWFASGLLPSVKAGPKLRYVTPQQLEQFLESSGRVALKSPDGESEIVAGGAIEDDDINIPDDVMARLIEQGHTPQSAPGLTVMAVKPSTRNAKKKRR